MEIVTGPRPPLVLTRLRHAHPWSWSGVTELMLNANMLQVVPSSMPADIAADPGLISAET